MSIEIVLVRHAIAFERDRAHWPDDRERPLSPEGKEKFRKAAAGLTRWLPDVDWVLTSPLTRARETAEILEEIGGWPQVRSCPELAPQSSPTAVLAMLKALKAKHVALIGHEPHLSALLSVCVARHALLTAPGHSIRRMTADSSRRRPATLDARSTLLAQIATALAHLRGTAVSDSSVHSARKSIKQARATLRLMRDAARPLNATRDATVSHRCTGPAGRGRRAGDIRHQSIASHARNLTGRGKTRHHARAEWRGSRAPHFAAGLVNEGRFDAWGTLPPWSSRTPQPYPHGDLATSGPRWNSAAYVRST